MLYFFLSCTQNEIEMQDKTSKQNNQILIGEFIKKNNRLFILNLPYNVKENISIIFDEDTPYAIDIIEIYADTKKLSFIEDIRDIGTRTSFRIINISEKKEDYFISMYWYLYGNLLRWNDGRGIIFEKVINNDQASNVLSYKPLTNTYALTRDMKHLVIKYRILYPYPSLTIDDLYNKTNNENYSNERIMIVDLSNIFN